MPCGFCHANLKMEDLLANHSCPVCKALLVYDRDPANAIRRARADLVDTRDPQILAQVAPTGTLVTAWDGAERLTTTEVGTILGVSYRTVFRQITNGRHPHAKQDKNGFWSLPRSDVYAERMRPKRSASKQ